jgi:hypothetical protein
MPNLPKEYKAAVFEAKGEPLTFKQVPLELPKPGEVRTVEMLVPTGTALTSSSKGIGQSTGLWCVPLRQRCPTRLIWELIPHHPW